jgi:hypothetical protein
MTTWRAAAVLLAINTVVFLLGIALAGSSAGADRPGWLPPVWFRAAGPLVIAAGLWLGYRWAWWLGVVMCSVLLLWTGLASLVLAFGGYFGGEGAASRTVHLSMLLATWVAALALLLSPGARAMGRLTSGLSGPA